MIIVDAGSEFVPLLALWPEIFKGFHPHNEGSPIFLCGNIATGKADYVYFRPQPALAKKATHRRYQLAAGKVTRRAKDNNGGALSHGASRHLTCAQHVRQIGF